ncbi:thiamine monophosphate kinase [Alkalihalobacillus alcalophilus ATCC 27647 = CGMCC 1.3604]|uniref:Thiamine-monophosphate kinase n=1 Tax=Alkalihalobacillus alcalophilus ATCC 27647 = CGMCC 1.3604 TaxID=1218173 RepID=A0A094WP69_ALKAL|nr:thiamine-phosphate kinase [Alkalihalobacillus alcalophilus]KGA97773.1 thiamine monophosphate kinase [Alkalihalobacillus alcalophilus ATCC 27647 = CGMCC 1.3604]MED1562464.1 thiamine-phosphate kinase [Alkalihalobacillus alcalophilus]THG90761.1 thiamine monophosphate kinase [Alkalihalobacillus alcalophilus ATCC 27647 = CGMCC 1.3604]
MDDEFAFIDSVTPTGTKQEGLVVGIGDDAAMYQATEGFNQVICVDTMVEGIHFRKDTLTPYQIGRKVLAINLSDIAAMGAIPRYFVVSIAVPSTWNEEELQEIYRGMNELAERYNVDLIGGDTVSTNSALVLTITTTGEVEQGKMLLRSVAKPGDIVFLTGEVGGSAAGLDLLNKRGLEGPYTEEEMTLVKIHQEPKPQIEAGRILAEIKERVALNDVSDGVASEANELATASQVTIEIDAQCLPGQLTTSYKTREQALEWALFGGEDFQLIGTTSETAFPKLVQLFKEKGIRLTAIGKVYEGKPEVWLKDRNKKGKLDRKGYNHFQKR